MWTAYGVSALKREEAERGYKHGSEWNKVNDGRNGRQMRNHEKRFVNGVGWDWGVFRNFVASAQCV